MVLAIHYTRVILLVAMRTRAHKMESNMWSAYLHTECPLTSSHLQSAAEYPSVSAPSPLETPVEQTAIFSIYMFRIIFTIHLIIFNDQSETFSACNIITWNVEFASLPRSHTRHWYSLVATFTHQLHYGQ